jgi:hypothetical protein
MAEFEPRFVNKNKEAPNKQYLLLQPSGILIFLYKNSFAANISNLKSI